MLVSSLLMHVVIPIITPATPIIVVIAKSFWPIVGKVIAFLGSTPCLEGRPRLRLWLLQVVV